MPIVNFIPSSTNRLKISSRFPADNNFESLIFPILELKDRWIAAEIYSTKKTTTANLINSYNRMSHSL